VRDDVRHRFASPGRSRQLFSQRLPLAEARGLRQCRVEPRTIEKEA
jgi:hypothetical protein